MSLKIQKVAVLGSGVMGAQIAAHIANTKIPVLLFDLNQNIVEKGLEFEQNRVADIKTANPKS